MKRVAAIVAALALAASAPVRAADDEEISLNFTPPAGWTPITAPPTGRAGIYRSWSVRDGDGASHTLVLALTSSDETAATYAARVVAELRASGTSRVESAGALTTCGDVPASGYVFSGRVADGSSVVFRHVLIDVRGYVADASYARPAVATERADALDALDELCETRIAEPVGPPGWARLPGDRPQPGNAAFVSPDGHAKLVAAAVAMPSRRGVRALDPTQPRPGVRLDRDVRERCGTIEVRRARLAEDERVTESLAGYAHGIAYLYAYTRPAGAPLERAAYDALAGFCPAAQKRDRR